MEIATHFDMTIPLWGVIGSVCYAVYHVIKLTNKVEKLEETMVKINNCLDSLIEERKRYEEKRDK